MVAPLRRVMLCTPDNAGWQHNDSWRELGYLRAPAFVTGQKQHEQLRKILLENDSEILDLPAADDLSLDAVYAHDASFITDAGAIILRMGKPSRASEPQAHVAFYSNIGVPILGEIKPPGTAEAGDMVWLDTKTVLIGRGYRTNASGINQLRAIFATLGVEVLAAPLPHCSGPGCCLHLMSLISLLDESAALVDLPWLSVETLELLGERGFRLIEIDPAEREMLACNVLALGNGKLLAFQENAVTNQRLQRAGFDVKTFPGSEIGINGGGGPTCLTRPILRG